VEDVKRLLSAAFAEHRRVVELVEANAEAVVEAAGICALSLRAGNKILLCGNGGSAADAQHLAAEFVGRYLREREAWPAIALTTNTSALTAIGNDYSFDDVFARQVAAYGRPGDVLVAISTSGESGNVVRAEEAARERGLKVIALTGREGGSVGAAADVHLNLHSSDTPRVQEGHILIGHILCALVEEVLWRGQAPWLSDCRCPQALGRGGRWPVHRCAHLEPAQAGDRAVRLLPGDQRRAVSRSSGVALYARG
jgi:D-sedoheptulose 7-phosphate isomerase